MVDEIGYGREVADNVRGFVTVRIGRCGWAPPAGSSTAATRSTSAGCSAATWCWRSRTSATTADKAFLMGAVLIRLTEHLRLRQRAEGPAAARLRHLTVVEEAHRLLRQPPPGTGGGPAAHAVEMFAELLAEIRAYGEGLIIAEQIPAKLIPDVIKNTAVKVVHRLPAADDRDSVGATMNLTPAQSALPGHPRARRGRRVRRRHGLPGAGPHARRHRTRDRRPGVAASPGRDHRRAQRLVRPGVPAGPCTLRQMRAAQQRRRPRPADHHCGPSWPSSAHLTGWLMPMPGPGLGRRPGCAGPGCGIARCPRPLTRRSPPG